MSQNIGTLVTSPLRPNDSLDPIAVVFSSEGKGGHHSYATYADMLYAQANYPDRFEFGMLSTIYADPTQSNNNTYQLQYNYYNTSATNSNNWVQYSGIPQTKPIEWQDSVLSRTSSIPYPLNNGDRYLITGPIGGTATDFRSTNWDGHTDNIATYDSRVSFWNFTLPFEGMTVRADDERGVIYKYTGIYGSAGLWVKEYVNQVYSLTASSNDGINFTADANLVGYYKPCVFYTRFLTASVGPNMYFNINNLGSASVVKIVGTTLQANIAAGDFVTSLEYQLIWDGTQFQVPFNSSVTSIGNPEVGNTYSGGVYNYPSFQPSTTIGTAIDRFNRILAALVPLPSPDLFTQSSSVLGAAGKSSFGPTNPNIVDFNNNSAYGTNALDNNISSSGLRLGIFAATTSTNDRNKDITGRLNNSVTATDAYPQYSFNNVGYLYLVVNGLTVSTATLSNTSAIDTTYGLSRPGFILGPATASKFTSGAPFDNFYGRTGSWFIPKSTYCGPYNYNASIGLTANQYGFSRGFNNINIIQDTTTSIINLSPIEIVLDDNPVPITLGVGALSTPAYGSLNYLSGIQYYSYVQLNYSVIINNAYYNVYSNSANAIVISNNSSGSGTPAPSFVVNAALPILSGNLSYLTSYPYSTGSQNFNSHRRIGESIGCYVSSVSKPSLNSGAQGFNSTSGAPASLTGIYLDSFITGTTPASGPEDFKNETNRIPFNTGYDTISSVVAAAYDSTVSLQTNSELQISNVKLIYPLANFKLTPGNLNGTPVGSAPYPNPNYNISTADYTSCSGTRYYYRRFNIGTSPVYQNFNISITGDVVLKSSGSTLTNLSKEIKLEIKFPGSSSKLSDWLDTSQLFNTSSNPLNYGTPCNYSGTVVSTITTNKTWALNVGYLGYNVNNSSSGSNGYILVRVVAPQGWTGNISQISIVGL